MRAEQFNPIFIVLILSFGLSQAALAQYGNEWINYDLQYWEFKIVDDGLYSVSKQELQSVGFPTSGIDPRNIKLYGKGKQIPLYFPGESDGVFDDQDKIYFYAKSNDGWLDSLLYDGAAYQNNPFYSHFTDTAKYYLSSDLATNGQRIFLSSDDNFEDYTPHPYVWHKSLGSYTSNYFVGQQDEFGISLPWYQEAEGWFDSRFAKGASSSKDIPTPLAYQGDSAPQAKVKAVSASASLATGVFNHHLQVGFGASFQLAVDTTYYGYQLNKLEFEIPNNALGNTTRITHRSIDDLNVASDYHAISHIVIDYPHQMELSSLPFKFTADDYFENQKAHLRFGGVESATALYRFGANGNASERISLETGEGYAAGIATILENGNEFVLVDENQSRTVLNLRPIGNSGNFTNYLTSNLDSAFVIITHRSLWNEAQNYSLYRQSQGMNTLVVDIDQLYHQFSYGIEKHPLSIRRFCQYLGDNLPIKPSHLFIIGKSIQSPSISNTAGSRKSIENYHNNLVPTYGYPCSDIALTSGIYGEGLEPFFPTGRIAAKNGAEVLEYLNKVIEMEQQEPALWMKRILHFGGGANAFEQGLFAGYLNDYKEIAQDTCFGAEVHTFLKTSSDPIQFNLSDSIRYLIEEGVSVMTFFGHASSTGFDQNIDSPSSYNNQGKYPVLIGNSCYTGNIHLPTATSTSENFVLYPEGGMIGFIAKGDLGSPYYLDFYTFNLYKAFSTTLYGASIGQCMRHAINQFAGNGGNLYVENTALTFGLHGDPALQLYPHALPDYTIKSEDVYFDPPRVTAEIDSFDVVIDLYNIGKATGSSLSVEVIRELPNGETENLQQSLDELILTEQLRFRFPVDRVNGIGLNRFNVLVDLPNDLVPELVDFNNNTVYGRELLITSGDLVPVYPPNFALVPDTDVTLKASTGNSFEEEFSYQIQLDTIPSFNSGFLQEFETSQAGGVVEWTPLLLPTDSLVYYWRSSGIPAPGEEPNWRNSSFQVVAGKTGWGQAHPGQLKQNSIFGTEWVGDILEFPEVEVSFSCQVYGNANDNFESLDTQYQIDLDIQDYSGCGTQPAIHVAVLDSLTFRPWETNYNGLHPQWDFGNLLSCTNSRQRPEKYFIFRQNNADQLLALENMLSNEVPSGNYLLVYTWRYVTYSTWENFAPGLFDVFSDLGASQIGNGLDSVPFIFFQKLGDPSTRIEVYGVDREDVLNVETELTGAIGISEMKSQSTGNSAGWREINWEFDLDTQEDSDSSRFKVMGIRNNGLRQELSAFSQPDGSWNNLINQININEYPKLAFELRFLDTLNLTSPQINYWHVVHDPVPEAALNPYFALSFPQDSVQEGEFLEFAVAIQNIGEVDMDSLLVRYWIEDSERINHPIYYQRQDSLRVGEILLDTLQIATNGLGGSNLLWVEINPDENGDGIYDQREQTHFNNIGQLKFEVINDIINPILDVTFDGRRLLDGELVSANPNILITLRDENQFFLLNEDADTSNFKLYLSPPGAEQEAIYFAQAMANDEIEWVPAGNSENKFTIIYSPNLTQDGKYRLIVQATDKSGNQSGSLDYEINFEVSNQAAITEVLNYPNPFSTRTQFVFTLTGREVPDYMKIQIMTISGRVVREIHQDELGPLHIGRNLTEYWWDGKDEFGDPLANGVYLYRVIARLNGEELDLRSTAASSYFKEGYGKMYLLR